MRPGLPLMLVLGLGLASCGRDADNVAPAESDPRNADPAAEGTMMDMGSATGVPPSDPAGTGSPLDNSGVPTPPRDSDAEPLEDAPAEPIENDPTVPPRQ